MDAKEAEKLLDACKSLIKNIVDFNDYQNDIDTIKRIVDKHS